MKIKAVCEKTGLNDKTIRYYIRSGLIFPKYNENYTGRKNFDFSEKDIERLNQVVILRKYNFSINSIKEILDNSENIDIVVKSHIENMREENNNSAQLLF
ncbi:MAG: MerR family transcriptional regulator [Acetobacter sp.]|nr:MerR family transcriptional regulator [Bacteroides sp.]MCM1340211.1 MerR family transcriptional regulator [Acetobacter sp.]MCM1432837.1 MerR family transcriptional regulator [Clostridiales bacterium]